MRYINRHYLSIYSQSYSLILVIIVDVLVLTFVLATSVLKTSLVKALQTLRVTQHCATRRLKQNIKRHRSIGC